MAKSTDKPAVKKKVHKHGPEISCTEHQIVRFKEPGGRVTIGGQTFHQGNITKAAYEGLVAIDKSYADLFEVHTCEHKSCHEHGEGPEEESEETEAAAGPAAGV